MKLTMQFVLVGCALAFGFVFSAEKASGKPAGANIALGKPYEMAPAPDYERCKDDGDNRQLTDGEIYDGNGQLWVQKGAAGWRNQRCRITVDLGEVKSIGGVGFHSGFDGRENVPWPSSISVFTSENGRDYLLSAGLGEPAWGDGGLPSSFAPYTGRKNMLYWYRRDGLQARGRFVTFVVQAPYYVFCDEVEVLEGDARVLQEPFAGKFIKNLEVYLPLRSYFNGDIREIRKNASNLDKKENETIEAKINAVEDGLADIETDLFRTLGYRATAPLNDLHRGLLRINAEALRLSGASPLAVWHKHRWDPLEATEIPESVLSSTLGEKMLSYLGLGGRMPVLRIESMNGEYRAETLNLTNVRPEDQEVTISFENLPGGKTPSYIRVHQVEYAATREGKMIADALPDAEKDGNGYKIKIPSGMTRQIWVGIHPEGLTPGSYDGRIVIDPKGHFGKRKVEFNLAVAPFNFPDRPRLSFYLWDYTDKPYGFAGMTDANVKLAIEDMKAHFVDTPYGHAGSACFPDKDAFDAEGKLVGKLKTEGFDDWVSRWKEVRYYGLYLGNHLPDFVADETPGSERFNRKIAQWSAAFAEYAEKKGIPPERIMLHLFDECSKPEQYRLNTMWIKAIKQGCSRFRLFVNPASKCDKPVPELAEMLEQYNVMATLFPHYGIPEMLKTESMKPGKELHLNNSPGGGDSTRLLDPYYYHLLLAWHCWKNGALGMSTWTYWNYPLSAWNEVKQETQSYGLVYTTDNSITGGKHFEAIRESIEDYEYLAMLKDKMEEAKKNGKNPAAVEKAETFFRDVPKQVAGQYDRAKRFWNADKDRSAADTARNQILQLMKELEMFE